jgi:hypothetical protein
MHKADSKQEMYGDYEGGVLDAKLSSKTDVFGIGQIMWNMLMNCAEWQGAPFLDDSGTEGWYLVNGEENFRNSLSAEAGQFLSGKMPYEASVRYSAESKNLARQCLSYQQNDRPSVRKLKKMIVEYRKEDLFNNAKEPLQIRVETYMDKFRSGARVDTTEEGDPEEE